MERPDLDVCAAVQREAKVVQVVPALPPAVDGLGDYAALLARAMGGAGLSSRFVAVAPGAAEVEGCPVTRLRRRHAAELHAALEEAAVDRVILHYSGYGYARRGLCFWLADGLCRWRRQGRGRRLITVFHELYATGPIWRGSFWTAVPQRAIARRLTEASDAMLATSASSAERLRAWRPDCPAVVSPVFSNVGELDAPALLAERAPTAVVFGKAGGRLRAYAAMQGIAETMAAALGRLGVTRVLDVGPRADVPAEVAGLPVEVLGPLSAGQLSETLAGARAGLVDYPYHVLTKSGIVAAYLAHGLPCLNLSEVGTLPDDLAEGREFAHPRTVARAGDEFDAQAVATAGHAWYRGHDREITAATVAKLLE